MSTRSHGSPTHGDHYRNLFVMTALSFVAMYVLMYAMVDRLDNVFNSLNQVYMAGLMTSPMVVIELVVMRGMYRDKKRNLIVAGAACLALLAFWLLTRSQTAISDRQFLRSMIPHHAGAVLMCERAPIQDAEIKSLCQGIVSGQKSEIERMKTMLRDLRN